MWHFTPEQKPDNNFSQPRKFFQFSIQPKEWIDDWKVGKRRILEQVGDPGGLVKWGIEFLSAME